MGGVLPDCRGAVDPDIPGDEHCRSVIMPGGLEPVQVSQQLGVVVFVNVGKVNFTVRVESGAQVQVRQIMDGNRLQSGDELAEVLVADGEPRRGGVASVVLK